MKNRIQVLIFLLTTNICFGQSNATGKRGDFFAYWGWNRAWFSHSDIHFTGKNYDFTLHKVIAADRPTKFAWNVYFNPELATIPQYNFRFGYYLSDKYSLSVGSDHMKYVMRQNQFVKIDGNIAASGTPYDGKYSDTDIKLLEDFLQYEHTDGLNYLNLELRRFDEFWRYKHFKLAVTEGIGAGMLVPKTNVVLLNNARNDQFHVAGWGTAAVVGLNFTFYKYFFLQTELKGGYFGMPSVRTTQFASDNASQRFFFLQYNYLFGFNFSFGKRHVQPVLPLNK
jgi:hypothetical protein